MYHKLKISKAYSNNKLEKVKTALERTCGAPANIEFRFQDTDYTEDEILKKLKTKYADTANRNNLIQELPF